MCSAGVIQQTLIAAGRLTQEDVDNGIVVDLVRCGDVTNDGSADGATGSLVLDRSGYKIGIARHNRRSFDVIQPHYGRNDPNCCPSSFRVRRYTWTGKHFTAGKAKRLKSAPRRFYKP